MPAIVTTDSWTYERMLAELPSESRYELVDGQLYDLSPAPNKNHQKVTGKIFRLLAAFVEDSGKGEVFFSPIDVVLADNTVFQPDIVVLLGNAPLADKHAIRIAPDVAVEVLSPRSRHRDTVMKLERYADFGIKEYWIVDPVERFIEIHTRNEKDGLYYPHSYGSGNVILSSKILEGFSLDVAKLFEGIA